MKPSPQSQHEVRSPRCARILHAEDDRVTARHVASFLTTKGHHVETVANGRDALARVVAQPGFYDVLIADHVMPELTGLQCVSALRKRGYPGKIIVFASPLPTEVEKQFLVVGVSRILHKSSDLTLLHDAIQQLLSASADANESEQFLPPHKQDAPARSAEAGVKSGVGEQQQDKNNKP